MDKELQSQYRIVAGGDNVRDVIKLLRLVADRVADIRTPIAPGTDTVETRKAINTYLQDVVDRLSRVNDTVLQSSLSEDDTDGT